MKSIMQAAVVAIFATLALANDPALALVIVPTFDATITSDPNAAAIEGVINGAISTYETTFTDPITVRITFAEMTSGLGGSSTFVENVPWSTYLGALTADAKTSNDATALAHIPVGPTNPVNGSTTIEVTTANLRAVGLPTTVASDGTVGLNTHLTDIGSPGTSGQFSLLATTEHNIDEVLGLISSLPSISFGTIFPEDLFRYDASGNRSFTTSSTARAFFSIDGTTDLAQFDNQNDGGDFGDWQANPLPTGVSPQVQDAFATPGADPSLGVELTALDVIGYDLAVTQVPEPGSLALFGIPLAGVWLMRHRKAA